MCERDRLSLPDWAEGERAGDLAWIEEVISSPFTVQVNSDDINGNHYQPMSVPWELVQIGRLRDPCYKYTMSTGSQA